VKIIEVEYLRNANLSDMETEVEQYLKDGWQIYGTLVINYDSEQHLVQTVVKYATEKPTPKSRFYCKRYESGQTWFLVKEPDCKPYWSLASTHLFYFDTFNDAREASKNFHGVTIEEEKT